MKHTLFLTRSGEGIVFSADEKYLYASGGNDNLILQYIIQNNRLVATDTFNLGRAWLKELISPTGITLDDNKMYIWEQASRSGVSFRTYGEFATRKSATLPVLEGHSVNTFDGYPFF